MAKTTKPVKKDRCVSNVYHESIRTLLRCAKSATVWRSGKGYCAVHDPVRRAAKTKEWHDAFDAEQKASDATFNAARRIAKRLGCGEPYFYAPVRGIGRYERAIVVSFDDVERLIKRLERK